MQLLKFYGMLILMGFSWLSYGQNLIPNYSFEENLGCPTGIFLIKSKWIVKDWQRATSGTPDYYHRCASHEVTIPFNWAGKAQPVHGDAYMGIYLWGGYREFVKVKLLDSLEAGAAYRFEGYFQIASNSHFVVGDIGAVFYRADQTFSERPPQIVVSKRDPLDGEPLEWEKLAGSFVAQGGESYLAIGHLDQQKRTEATELTVNKDKEFQLQNRSYAYIDHFRLWKVGTEEPTDSAFLVPQPDKFTLSDVNFEFDSYQLRETAGSSLAPLVDYLQKLGGRDYVVLITGHTDDQGDPQYNQRLSRNRARAVAVFLLKEGIPRNLLKTFGKGEGEPILPNTTEENRFKNRRVEIEIVEQY